MVQPADNTLFIRATRNVFNLFFRLLYHEFAWTYDWVAAAVSIGRWETWILSVLPYLENSVILELGSGPGHLQLALAEKGVPIFGLDASWQMTKQARMRMNQNSFSANITHGKAQYLPFASGQFDRLVATFPSEYIIDPETLTQARRVLRDNGELIILPAAWITGTKLWDRLAAGLFRITGQAPNNDLETGVIEAIDSERYLNESGFAVSREIIQFPSSKVLLIRATKYPDESNQRELG